MKKIIFLMLAMVVMFAGCKSCKSREESKIGTEGTPLVVGFMPSAGSEVMEAGAKVIADELSKKSGLVIEPFVAKNYMSLIDGLASKKIDAAFINPLGYLLAHDWCRAEPIFQLVSEKGKTSYKSAVITRYDSGINAIADISGRTFAYSDPFSMAGYLMPLSVFTDSKIIPKSTVFAGSYYNVVEMIYGGLIDAGAIYFSERDPDGRINDARLKLVNKYNDLLDKVPVIFVSDPIPMPPIVVRKELGADLKERLKRGFELASLEAGAAGALKAMYDAGGIAPVDEKSFDNIRTILKRLGKDVEEVVPGALDFYRKHIWEVTPAY